MDREMRDAMCRPFRTSHASDRLTVYQFCMSFDKDHFESNHLCERHGDRDASFYGGFEVEPRDIDEQAAIRDAPNRS
jgi:hypothetical protein